MDAVQKQIDGWREQLRKAELEIARDHLRDAGSYAFVSEDYRAALDAIPCRRTLRRLQVELVERSGSKAQTAIHEAGHAVVAHVLGVRVASLTTVPKGTAAGHVVIDLKGVSRADNLCITAAGIAGTDILICDSNLAWAWNGGGDLEDIRKIIGDPTAGPTHPEVDAAFRRAFWILMKNRSELMIVALMLDRFETLDRDQFLAAVEHASVAFSQSQG